MRLPCLLALPLLMGCVSATPAPLLRPIAPVAPMLDRAGDLHASLGLQAGSGPEARLAYAPLPHVLAFGSAVHTPFTAGAPGMFERSYAEAGVGFWVRGGSLSAEVLGGAGAGLQGGTGDWAEERARRCAAIIACLFLSDLQSVEYSYRTATRSLFGQVNLGWIGAGQRIALTSRLTDLRFRDMRTTPAELPTPGGATSLDVGLLWRIDLSEATYFEFQGGQSIELGGAAWEVYYDERFPLFSRGSFHGGVRVGVHPFR